MSAIKHHDRHRANCCTAFYAEIGDGKTFKSDYHVSAWLGLVPNQHSTGGKHVLLDISKRGNTYLRTQLINGARSALRHRENKTDQVSIWARKLKERSNYNNETVALANKMARMAWEMLHHQEDYKYYKYEQLIEKPFLEKEDHT